ncbi:metabotropic glutamate receptor 3 [Plakobranchus ocellatus]|uniref:Metabotropic glutamate receptor 3 n=1 Tax=Plakobranchus ocellatus TaxID=259542 RepID=A0AAV4A7N2_9GAST|nr:metabotropic glutamate receptor 3 [Plakobranchus ocellatus]
MASPDSSQGGQSRHHQCLRLLMWQVAALAFLLALTATTGDMSFPPVSDRSANSTKKSLVANIHGDIILGGLFPVHDKGEKMCGSINLDRGIERLEAMLYTIDEINDDPELLPGIKLGASVLDTCGRAPYALEQSLEFIRASFTSLDPTEFVCRDGSEAKAKSTPTTVVGVVGGSYSTVSIQVANLLRLFKIPQISYASTSASLSDKQRYDYFIRTVPPDTLQAKALVDIVQEFNWTYVSIVHSEGEYGESGIDFFKHEAKAKNICIAASKEISLRATNATYDEVIKELQDKPEARVVIVFVRSEDATGLLNAAARKNLTGKFVWIASDGWGNRLAPVKNNPLVAQGAITLELQSTPILGFEKYFLDLNPRSNHRNPWFVEYWEEEHKCSWNRVRPPTSAEDWRPFRACKGNERINRRITSQENKVQFIYDAVYAFAHALHDMQEELCPGTDRLCPAMANIDGETLLRNYLLNVSFDDERSGACGEPQDSNEVIDLTDLVYNLHRKRRTAIKKQNKDRSNSSTILSYRQFLVLLSSASLQQNDLRLSGPSSDEDAGGKPRTHDRKVPAGLREDSLSTVPPTPHMFVYKNR